MSVSYLDILFFLFGSCKGKTTSNKFYKFNLNLLQVFIFRKNNFSTLDDIFATVCWEGDFHHRAAVACQYFFFCVCVKTLRIELKDVNLKLVVYLICPRFSK